MANIPLPIKKKEEQKLYFSLDASPEIPALPDNKKEDLNVKYPLIPPYAYAHIHWDSVNHELVYSLDEPQLNNDEKTILNIIEDGVKELINISYISVKRSGTIIEYLEKNLQMLLKELKLQISKETYLKIMYYIYRDFVGLNEIEPLLWDYFIEDIECNGTDQPIYIVHRKYRNIRTNITFNSTRKLASFVEKLAQKAGQYISYANPLLDGALPDGSRVNATFTEDISSKGPTFTIRKFTKIPWSPTALIQLGTVSPQMLAYLWLAIEYEMNVMIIGGTASGKTTLLNALTTFIPPQARIVSIEDTRELNLQHSNWLPSVAREGVGLSNLIGQKYGEVSLLDLLRESFRQNPDYVIVGEVRGKEAYVLFQGMASGHPSFGTMHANSVDTMIKRLETPPINLSSSLVESMDIVCIMVQTKIKGKGVRKLKEIDEIINVEEGLRGKAEYNVPFLWDPAKNTFLFKKDSVVFDKLYMEQGITREELQKEFVLRTNLLIKLYQMRITDFKRVRDIINEYYKTPQSILKQFKVI